jgi:hypothetical protein
MALIQGINTIFIDQMPTCLVLKKSIFYAGIKFFNSLPPSIKILKNENTKFQAALRKYLHTHSFYPVDFLCVKMIYNTVFVNQF